MLSRIFLSLALGLSINMSIASESLEGSSTGILQEVIAGKKDPRQRSLCGSETRNPPHVWALDICQSRSCYASPNEVSLWLEERPDRTAQVSVENLDSSTATKLRWKASDTTLAWSKELPIKSGASYQIKIWNRTFQFQKEISLYQIPTKHKTVAAKAKWMREHGCQSQAKMLQP
jgi:hypothetical protein